MFKIIKDKDYSNQTKSNNLFSNSSFLSVSSKVIHLSSHALTLLLISNLFSLEEQGLFFLFHSLISLQIFVELGMGNVIQNFSSHEVEIIRSATDPKSIKVKRASDQLGYIFKIGVIWFGCGSILLTFILTFFGSEFISATNTYYKGWQLIWIITGLLVSMLVAFQVFWSIIQGCNWVLEYYRFKIFQIFLGNITLWIIILADGKLWSIVGFVGAQVLVATIYLLIRFRHFFYKLYKQKLKYNKLTWKKDLLPFQSLIFISFFSGYLAFNIQVPLTSILFGVEEAGKVGASWQLVGLISIISYAFIAPHGPQIAMWAQSKKYFKIKPYIQKISKTNLLIVVGLSIGLLLSISFIKLIKEPSFVFNIIERLGSTPQIIFMIIGHIAVSATIPLSIYLRAHKKEPIAHLSLIAGIFTLVGSYYFSIYLGVVGIGLGFMLSQLIVLPFIIFKYKKYKLNFENKN